MKRKTDTNIKMTCEVCGTVKELRGNLGSEPISPGEKISGLWIYSRTQNKCSSDLDHKWRK